MEGIKMFEGYVEVYMHKRTHEILLGSPYETKDDHPKYWEYDCADHVRVGTARVKWEKGKFLKDL